MNYLADENMEDDDIDYDITFPSPHTDLDDSDEVLDEYVFEGESKEPVVFLVGWAGCQPKHLAKYSKIYEKRWGSEANLLLQIVTNWR